MSDETQRELQSLKDLAASLTNRIRVLEQKIALSDKPATPAPSAQAKVKASQPLPASVEAQKESFESRIGRFWLQRVGMGSLVLGVVFFILYSFQYLGPLAKIAIGYAVGSGLLALGIVIERQKGLAWYGRGLRGGGWAIIYFTTYAMHHIPATRIIQDSTISLLLLLLVATAAVSSALKRRSEVEAAFAFLLGFLTIFVSHVTFFTLGSAVLLTVAIVVVAVRMRWADLCLGGALGSHLTQMFLAPRLIGLNLIGSDYADIAIAQFWLNTAFLMLYWAGYTYAVLAFGQTGSRDRRVLMTATLVNSLLFGTQILSSLPHIYWDERYLAPLILGAVHLLLSVAARRRKTGAIAETHLLLGLTWVAAATSLKLADRWTECVWSLEMAGLLWLGFRFKRWAYRLFASGLGFLLLFHLFLELAASNKISILWLHVSQRLVTVLMGTGAYAVAAALYRLKRFKPLHHATEYRASHVYMVLASFFLTCILSLEAASRWLSLTYAIEGLGLLGLGFVIKDRVLRICGLVVFGMLVVKILFVDLAQAETIYRILSFLAAGAVLLAASYAYARFEAPKPSSKKLPV